MYDQAALRRELSRDEGRKLVIYLDSKKIWSAGVGWNLEANGIPADVLAILPIGTPGYVEPGLGAKGIRPEGLDFVWPDEAIDALLDRGIAQAERVLDELVPGWHAFCDETVPLGGAGDVRTRALLNLAFNMGKGRVDAEGHKHGLMSFEHFLAAADAGRWEEAVVHLRGSAWERDVGPGRAGRVERMIETGVA